MCWLLFRFRLVFSGVWGFGSGVGVLAAGRLRPRGECEQAAVLRLGHGASLDLDLLASGDARLCLPSL